MLTTFQPLLDAARGVDLTDPSQAEAELKRRFDPGGAAAQDLTRELVQLLEEGRIAERGDPGMKWGRVCKATDETFDFSIDVVHMNDRGPRHRHPNGEIDFCIPLEGDPTFDGRPAGWVVFGPDSVHVPTVANGVMLIVYLLPGGAMEFLG